MGRREVSALKLEEDGIQCEEDEEEEEFTKNSFNGVAGTPGRVLPERDHGAREAYPAYAPEPREESQGGKGLCLVVKAENAKSENAVESENADDWADLNAVLEILDVIQEETGVNIAPMLRMSRPPSPMISPRSDEYVQTEDVDVNPAPGGEMLGPRCDLEERSGRMEHTIVRVRDTQLQEAQRKKRARKARKRREKRRRGDVAFAEEAPGDGPVKGPVDSLEISEAWVPISVPRHDWIPRDLNEDETGTRSDSDSGEGVGRMNPPTEEEQTRTVEVPTADERRVRFRPKPLTPERELARLRRREKKIMCNQIREQKTIMEKKIMWWV
jgi:hypothetical protein